MIVRIAKIKALTAPRPSHAAFDFDTHLSDPLLPGAKVFHRNAEGEMQVAAAIVRWNHTAGQRHRFQSAALAKQDQDVASGNVKGAEAFVECETAKAE